MGYRHEGAVRCLSKDDCSEDSSWEDLGPEREHSGEDVALHVANLGLFANVP